MQSEVGEFSVLDLMSVVRSQYLLFNTEEFFRRKDCKNAKIHILDLWRRNGAVESLFQFSDIIDLF